MTVTTQRIVSTYTAQIYVGLCEGHDRHDFNHDFGEAQRACDAYVDRWPLCVTLTKTEFHYVGGWEPGVIVGLIDCPQVPMGPEQIREHAIRLAGCLLERFGQERVTVVFTDRTVMIEKGK
jgi:hypothetical protein